MLVQGGFPFDFCIPVEIMAKSRYTYFIYKNLEQLLTGKQCRSKKHGVEAGSIGADEAARDVKEDYQLCDIE